MTVNILFNDNEGSALLVLHDLRYTLAASAPMSLKLYLGDSVPCDMSTSVRTSKSAPDNKFIRLHSKTKDSRMAILDVEMLVSYFQSLQKGNQNARSTLGI